MKIVTLCRTKHCRRTVPAGSTTSAACRARRFASISAAMTHRSPRLPSSRTPVASSPTRRFSTAAGASRSRCSLPANRVTLCGAPLRAGAGSRRRALGQRPFDEQIVAALALDDGHVVEMQTGEGKTLAAVMPAALNALTGRGVHVLTFNDYLARRDAEWMGPIYRLLGLSVGCVQQGMPPRARRAAYGADVTYVTAKEAGFDHLRDLLAMEPAIWCTGRSISRWSTRPTRC